MRQHFSFSVCNEADAAQVREAYGPVAQLDFDNLSGKPERFDVTVVALPSIVVSTQNMPQVRAERSATQIARDGNDSLTLIIGLEGSGRVANPRHEDRRFSADGPALLLLNDEPSVAESNCSTRSLNLTVPRSAIEGAVHNLDRARREGIARTPALRLLTSYMQTLTIEAEPLSAEMISSASVHLRDLALLALGARRDEAEVASARGLRAARLAQLKGDILAHLTEPGLSLGWLAKRHRISVRYIRDLFYGEGISFTDFVLTARLDQAHRLLCDPGYVHLTVTSIALGSGFSDLSWFNEAYRRRFGMSPTDARRATRP